MKTKPKPKTKNPDVTPPMEVEEFALSILREQPVISVGEFEGRIHDRFEKEWPFEAWENVRGKRRKRWQNWCDWVKAKLFQQRELHYMETSEGNTMVYLPIAGSVNGTKLMEHRFASNVVDELMNLVHFGRLIRD